MEHDVAIIGCGRVGLPLALAFADRGLRVIGVEIDPERLSAVRSGRMPFDEPGARTPKYIQRAIRKAIADTSKNTGMVLTVAFDYGSRAELVHAAEQARITGDVVSEATIAQHLYLPQLPPVDVLVRTSGELRISNFMLWQIAGARVYFTERTWPEFDGGELDAALALLAS